MLNNRIVYLLTWDVAIFIKVYLCPPSNYSESKPLLLTVNVFKWGEVKMTAAFDAGPIPLALAARWQISMRIYLEWGMCHWAFHFWVTKTDLSHARPTHKLTACCWWALLTWVLSVKVREHKDCSLGLHWGKGQQGTHALSWWWLCRCCCCCWPLKRGTGCLLLRQSPILVISLPLLSSCTTPLSIRLQTHSPRERPHGCPAGCLSSGMPWLRAIYSELWADRGVCLSWCPHHLPFPSYRGKQGPVLAAACFTPHHVCGWEQGVGPALRPASSPSCPWYVKQVN